MVRREATLIDVGDRIVVDVGAAAHGGHCVARHEGRVVFVRHALPGERVAASVTEDHGGSFFRADAVEVLVAAAGRVVPPCRFAGPGRCGGCDWQHADPALQREIKAAVVRDVMRRVGHLDVEVSVEPLPGGPLGWRTRAQFATDSDGRLGLHRHRSHELEPIDDCLLVTDAVRGRLAGPWPPRSTVAIAGTTAEVRRSRRPPRGGKLVRERALGRPWRVRASGFWQVHPAAADIFAACVVDQLEPGPDDRVVDLYAGVGLFAGALAPSVREVLAIESDPDAVDDVRHNLRDLRHVEVRRGRVAADLIERLRCDLVVLDPPRAGAGRDVVQALGATGARAVCYVACDPAALARDLRAALDEGWQLAALRAFDAFPMTHHVECIALLTRRGLECTAADCMTRSVV